MLEWLGIGHLPLDFFEPMVQPVFAREAFSLAPRKRT